MLSQVAEGSDGYRQSVSDAAAVFDTRHPPFFALQRSAEVYGGVHQTPSMPHLPRAGVAQRRGRRRGRVLMRQPQAHHEWRVTGQGGHAGRQAATWSDPDQDDGHALPFHSAQPNEVGPPDDCHEGRSGSHASAPGTCECKGGAERFLWRRPNGSRFQSLPQRGDQSRAAAGQRSRYWQSPA